MSFIEVYFNSALQNVIKIDAAVATIGRAAHNLIRIENKGVSSLHASITAVGEQWFVEDLNSTNGTFVNGNKIAGKQKLNYGDTISICKHDLVLCRTQSHATIESSVQQEDFDQTVLLGQKQKTRIIAPQTTSKTAHVLVKGEVKGVRKLILQKVSYSIGRGKDNDLRVSGWLFTPKVIAELSKIGESYYLHPVKGKHAKVNGKAITEITRLSNDDNITIKDLSMKFVQE